MSRAKRLGQYFTPEDVAKTLVRWAIRKPEDRILDPSCGDGEFLGAHAHAVGIELDGQHAAAARLRAPAALVHESDFFKWAEQTHERFEAIVGNPPFIRYQGFSGMMRSRALRQAARFGAKMPELASSWAPFIAASALLLKRGGRLAFVVPAEIGHATYASPLLQALASRFERVLVVALREKLFPSLSEDAWLLFASGFGGTARSIDLAIADHFVPMPDPPKPTRVVPIDDLLAARGRLRRWLLPRPVLDVYGHFETHPGIARLGSIAAVGIGYVSGANDFFHLRPSVAKSLGIPKSFLTPAVRRGASLPNDNALTKAHVLNWFQADDPMLLLRIRPEHDALPRSIRAYLNCAAGQEAREAYKCRVRTPWYCVPDVTVPHGFLTYMNGERAHIVRNAARCVATNSVHVVRTKNNASFTEIQRAFYSALTELSCEVEGHPLGGGMLKIEPREAQRLLLPGQDLTAELQQAKPFIEDGIETMRRWRGYAREAQSNANT